MCWWMQAWCRKESALTGMLSSGMHLHPDGSRTTAQSSGPPTVVGDSAANGPLQLAEKALDAPPGIFVRRRERPGRAPIQLGRWTPAGVRVFQPSPYQFFGLSHRFRRCNHRVVFKTFTPLPVFHWLRRRWRRRFEKGFRKFTTQRVIHERGRIGDNGGDFLVQPRLVAAAKNEYGNKISRPARRLTKRNAQSQKIFRVHFIRSKITCE